MSTSLRSTDSEFLKNVKRFARRRVSVIGLFLTLTFVVVALAAPILATADPNEQHLHKILKPPGGENLLGTDELGRDIWSRLVYGSRVSIVVGFASVGLAILMGVPLGAIAGYYGGWVDEILMRFQDVMLAFPGVLLTMVLVIILGPSVGNMIFAVAVYGVPGFARLARGEVLSLRSGRVSRHPGSWRPELVDHCKTYAAQYCLTGCCDGHSVHRQQHPHRCKYGDSWGWEFSGCS